MEQGDILFGKYRVESKIGSGGMSEVYLCTNLQVGNYWAVKHIKDESIASLEEEVLKRLNHISLPKIADFYTDSSGTYIVESYIEGINMQNWFNRHGNIVVDTALEWIKQLCGVLEYLHDMKPEPIIYRDLKPSNILITRDNRIVLVDFGISKYLRKNSRIDNFIAGTNAYAAPEQLLLEGFSDKRSDIYSLGVIMQQLFSCKPPVHVNTLTETEDAVPEQIKRIIKKCLERRPENRYQSIAQLRSDLEAAEYEIAMEKVKNKLLFKILVALSFLFSAATYVFVFLGLKSE